MTKPHRLTFRLDSSTMGQLLILASNVRQNPSEWLRELIRAKIEAASLESLKRMDPGNDSPS